MPNDPPHLGIKLREAIRERGVSQADVARAFGVKAPTVSSDWLKHGRIDKKHYPKLVGYFARSYEWWFGPPDLSHAARTKAQEPPPRTSVQARIDALPKALQEYVRVRMLEALAVAESTPQERGNSKTPPKDKPERPIKRAKSVAAAEAREAAAQEVAQLQRRMLGVAKLAQHPDPLEGGDARATTESGKAGSAHADRKGDAARKGSAKVGPAAGR